MNLRRLGVLTAIAVGILVPSALWAGEGMGTKLTPAEAKKKKEELTNAKWESGEIGAAFAISKGDRSLFDTYVSLHNQKIPPPIIKASFEACKHEPALVSEYWEYAGAKYGFPLKEVQEVFATFPPNKMTRFYYFQWRMGGESKILNYDGTKEGPVVSGKKDKTVYSKDEVIHVFRTARFDVKLITAYFEGRNGGKKPPELLATLQKAVQDQITGDNAAVQKEKDEQAKKDQEKADAEKRMRERMAKDKEDEETAKKKATSGSSSDLDALITGTATKKEVKPPEGEKKDQPATDGEKKDQPATEGEKKEQPATEGGENKTEAEPPPGDPAMKLTAEEIEKKWKELSEQKWEKKDFDTAISVSRSDRALFDLYVNLRNQEVTSPIILASFGVCKYKAAAAAEYWEYAGYRGKKYGFPASEVQGVFKTFPAEKTIRFYYFAWRMGGEQKLLKYDAAKDGPVAGGTTDRTLYRKDEVMAVFKTARYDMKLITEYFEERGKGKSPQDLMAVLQGRVKYQQELEKETARPATAGVS